MTHWTGRIAGAVLSALLLQPLAWAARSPSAGFYMEGVQLYNSGHFSDATDAFDQAIRKRDHAKEAQDYLDRIRKETVERIRNRALTGVSKANWQTKYYFIHAVGNRLRVGISAQEIFDRNSINFREGAIAALSDLAALLAKADNAHIDIDLINEINQDTATDPELAVQQEAAVFSYLSLAARDALPKL